MSLLGSARSKTKRNCRSRLAPARPGRGLHRKSPRDRVALAGARRPRPLPGTGLWRRPLATNTRLVDCPQNRWPHAKSRAANPAAPRPLSNVLARPHPRPCRSERNRRSGPPTGLWPAIRFHQRRLARLGPRARRNEITDRRTQNRPAGPRLFLAWNNTPPRTYARVNTLRTDAAKLLEAWRSEEIEYDFVRRDWFEEN